MELEGQKEGSTPSRNRTKSELSKQMTTVVGHYYAFKAVRRRGRESRVGSLWHDKDLISLKL